MDPTYAPAWQELGLRSYYDATYSDGGEKMLQQSNDAYARALQLDPNLTVALGQQITNAVERGELGKAYDAAEALVKSRPQSAQAHFALSYVFRYAGMLEQSARECNARSRSIPATICSAPAPGPSWNWARRERAMDFLRLDAGSEWAAYVTPSLLVREGKSCRGQRGGETYADGAALSSRPAGSVPRIAARQRAGPHCARA